MHDHGKLHSRPFISLVGFSFFDKQLKSKSFSFQTNKQKLFHFIKHSAVRNKKFSAIQKAAFFSFILCLELFERVRERRSDVQKNKKGGESKK